MPGPERDTCGGPRIRRDWHPCPARISWAGFFRGAALVPGYVLASACLIAAGPAQPRQRVVDGAFLVVLLDFVVFLISRGGLGFDGLHLDLDRPQARDLDRNS